MSKTYKEGWVSFLDICKKDTGEFFWPRQFPCPTDAAVISLYKSHKKLKREIKELSVDLLTNKDASHIKNLSANFRMKIIRGRDGYLTPIISTKTILTSQQEALLDNDFQFFRLYEILRAILFLKYKSERDSDTFGKLINLRILKLINYIVYLKEVDEFVPTDWNILVLLSIVESTKSHIPSDVVVGIDLITLEECPYNSEVNLEEQINAFLNYFKMLTDIGRL